MSGQLNDGGWFRILAVVDDFTRECLALVADAFLSGLRVGREFDAIVGKRCDDPTLIEFEAAGQDWI